MPHTCTDRSNPPSPPDVATCIHGKKRMPIGSNIATMWDCHAIADAAISYKKQLSAFICCRQEATWRRLDNHYRLPPHTGGVVACDFAVLHPVVVFHASKDTCTQVKSATVCSCISFRTHVPSIKDYRVVNGVLHTCGIH